MLYAVVSVAAAQTKVTSDSTSRSVTRRHFLCGNRPTLRIRRIERARICLLYTSVRILSDGWQEAKIIQVHGSSYVVHLPNGVDVSKMWPMEVRRLGKLTAEDHAAGQYDLHDRVQVLVNGKWMEGEIRGQNLNMYDIKVPGVDTGFGLSLIHI